MEFGKKFNLIYLGVFVLGIRYAKDAFVLCRIFQKSGSGPKNGEQYGAPFEEEEWDDDEVTIVPGEDTAEEVVFSSNPYPEAENFIIDADEQVCDS